MLYFNNNHFTFEFSQFFSLSPLGVFSSSMYAAATFGVFSV